MPHRRLKEIIVSWVVVAGLIALGFVLFEREANRDPELTPVLAIAAAGAVCVGVIAAALKIRRSKKR
jgi:preprotein translocase subunit Sec61beta